MDPVTTSRNLFVGAAGLSFLLSVSLWFLAGSREQAIFVGLWVPSILALGNLLKPVTVSGRNRNV